MSPAASSSPSAVVASPSPSAVSSFVAVVAIDLKIAAVVAASSPLFAAVVAVVAAVVAVLSLPVVVVVVVESLGVAAAMQPSAASPSLRVLPQVVVVVGVPQALHLDLRWYGAGGCHLIDVTTNRHHRRQALPSKRQDNVYDDNYKDNSDSDDMTRRYRQRRGDKSHADLVDGHQPPPPPPPPLPGPCHRQQQDDVDTDNDDNDSDEDDEDDDSDTTKTCRRRQRTRRPGRDGELYDGNFHEDQ
ncbi:hypothetical protein EDB84DRAFT_1650472 [Lactarius hengduanensis]|nr:hypothetical protein EDB84DRAFT_1650472 [Lactarius hengduanensis]